MPPKSHIASGFIALGFIVAQSSSSYAQQALPQSLSPAPAEINQQSIPQSAWIDLRQSAPDRSKTQSAPNWVEAVSMTPSAAVDGTPKTIFRIRVARPPGDYRVLFFRLFFDDKADSRPELTVWDESGSQILRSGQLGSGIVNLPTSDSVIIPMNGISAIDVEVPGDGKTVRGAYLDWMTSSDVVHPMSAEHRDVIPEPFSSLPPLHSPGQDTERFGTVTASLASETISIGATPETGSAFQFGIESQPLLGLLTFEVASPRVDSPPEIYVNSVDMGPATLALPELADPGYRGKAEALAGQMHFQYTGWLRGQKLIPGSILKAGTNDIVVVNGAGAATSAIRATQIQLKYLWEKSDYLLQAGEQ